MALSPPVRLLPKALGGFFLAATVAFVHGQVPTPEMPGDLAAAPGSAEPPAVVAPAPVSGGIAGSVVRIFSTTRPPDVIHPWARPAPKEISGSGVIIEGSRILTNAHVVLYASQVQVQASDSDTRYPATVEAIAPGIDLAVLRVRDESLFATHPPIPRGSDLPAPRDPVTAYGYPVGGNSVSVTRGIVSRIEFALYTYPIYGLRIQIDAAVNPGNSGGPAIVGSHMIGLVTSHLVNAQNISYIVPCEEIELFLRSVARGPYAGKPGLFAELQPLQNPALRSFLQAGPAVTGVVLHRSEEDDPAFALKPGDIITRIGETPIDDEGMVRAGGLRIGFQYLIQKLERNGRVPLTIVRGGQTMAIDTPVSHGPPLLMPALNGKYSSYFICGPIGFVAANMEMASAMVQSVAAANVFSGLANPMIVRRLDHPAFPGEQLVVVGMVFPSPLLQGYGKPSLAVVKTVNGIKIRNLRHLVEVLRDSRDEYLIFEFGGRGVPELVLPRQEMIDSTENILNENGVRSQATADLLALWNSKPAP